MIVSIFLRLEQNEMNNTMWKVLMKRSDGIEIKINYFDSTVFTPIDTFIQT